MELKHYLATLRNWWWLLLLATLVAAGVSYAASSRLPPVYRTASTLIVGQFLQSTTPQAQDFTTSQQLAQSYAQVVGRQPLLQATLDSLGLDLTATYLAGQVRAAAVPGTQLIQISVMDTVPQRAKALADELARQLILQSPTPREKEQEQNRQFVQQQLSSIQAKIQGAEKQTDDLQTQLDRETSARGIQNNQAQVTALQQKITTWESSYARLLDFYRGSSTNYLSVVESAPLPMVPVSPDIPLNTAIAAAVGLTLAIGAALLLEYLDNTVKTPDEVERLLGLPAVGFITRAHKVHKPRDHLTAMLDPFSPMAEAYRLLRTNLQFSKLPTDISRLLVLSLETGEGKTTVACNLGISMAQAGKSVILCDTDLRRPSMHRYFGVSNHFGLTTLLEDPNLAPDVALQETPVPGLTLLASGPLPANPAELLGSEWMERRFEQMARLADVVILDSPAALAVADATILAGLSSGILVVLDAGRTRRDAARTCRVVLEKFVPKVSGVVLNRAGSRPARYEYYSLAGRRGRPEQSWRRIGSFLGTSH